MVQINKTVGGEGGLDISLSFHLHPHYPSCPPDVSVASTHLSRTQCHDIRQKLIDQAAALPPEPMVHQLVECAQVPVPSHFILTHASQRGANTSFHFHRSMWR